MTRLRNGLNAQISEREFSQGVVDLAHMFGWLVQRTHDSRRSPAGYPDLSLCHPKHGWFAVAELKTEKGKPSSAQVEWLDAFDTAFAGPRWGFGVWLWRPRDWDRIEDVLRRGPEAMESGGWR